MKLVVRANDTQKQEFLSRQLPDETELHWLANETALPDADAYFDLEYEENPSAVFNNAGKPLFVNAVVALRASLPSHAIRINAWPGFLKREILEVSGSRTYIDNAAAVLNHLGWKYEETPDTPGMVAARIIAMIINEAYYGLGEGLSTQESIDIAMELGTNYPFGPFEWGNRIGLGRIVLLLQKLAENGQRYTIAPALLDAASSVQTETDLCL